MLWVLIRSASTCCGYSLEVPPWGTSNEYPQHMFLWRNKKNFPRIVTRYFSISTGQGKWSLLLRDIDTLSKGVWALSKVFCLPSEKGSTLKGKNLLIREQFFPSKTPFQKGLGVQKSRQEIAKIVSLVKKTEIYHVYLAPFRKSSRHKECPNRVNCHLLFFLCFSFFFTYGRPFIHCYLFLPFFFLCFFCFFCFSILMVVPETHIFTEKKKDLLKQTFLLNKKAVSLFVLDARSMVRRLYTLRVNIVGYRECVWSDLLA